MQIIKIIVDDKTYQIEWALSEYFDELKGMKFMLNELAANQIIKIDNTAPQMNNKNFSYTNEGRNYLNIWCSNYQKLLYNTRINTIWIKKANSYVKINCLK